MFFQQFQTPGLGCYSYIIGCPQSGVAAVVDPRRDIEEYLAVSSAAHMRITHIFDTHVHADHISGARELQRATGAPIHIHESAPVAYDAVKLRQGDVFNFGGAIVRILHTPGHTPNSVSLLVFDPLRSREPQMLLTGDLLFVGDTGRPDLPGEEILDEQIRNLFNSLHETLGELPGHLEVYPAHGQGSLCGAGLSAKPHSTLGYERIANHRMLFTDFDAFKQDILSNLPMRPQSFSHIIDTNLKGAPLLPQGDEPGRPLTPAEVAALAEQGAVILDLRNSFAYSSAHIAGSINVDASEDSPANWVGTVVAPGSRLVLVLQAPDDFRNILTELRRIGYDDVLGYLAGGLHSWTAEGRHIVSLPRISAALVRTWIAGPNPPRIIDVRTPREFQEFHVEGALHMPFDKLLADTSCPSDPETETVVVCQSGYRSAIAAALLQQRGCINISSMAGSTLLLK